MSGTDFLTAIAVLAAVLSAAASVWTTVLNHRLVQATHRSIQAMAEQTNEVINGRLDSRAPRIVLRTARVRAEVHVRVQRGGRALREVSTAELLAHSLDYADLVLVADVTIANEGSVTAQISLDRPFIQSSDISSYSLPDVVFMAPGSSCALILSLEASIDKWVSAAKTRVPLRRSGTLVSRDGYSESVEDHLVLTLSGFCVTGPLGAPSFSADETALLAASLDRSVVAELTRRYYRSVADHSDAQKG